MEISTRQAFAPRIQQRLDALAQISAEPGAITRLYLTAEQARTEAVVAGIACVEALPREGPPPVAIEVVGFADEEGVRFAATLTGSRAFAGHLDPKAVPRAARRPEEILDYVEFHIEQGPMLEREGLPVGLVSAISGASRLEITLSGKAGMPAPSP